MVTPSPSLTTVASSSMVSPVVVRKTYTPSSRVTMASSVTVTLV